MNKQQALDRLSALENEAKALRDIIEAPEKQDSLLTKPVPESDEKYYTIGGIPPLGGFTPIARTARTLENKCLGGNFFQSQEIAGHYAKALNTFLLLRHQPGTDVPSDGRGQWFIELHEDNLLIGMVCRIEYKINGISPPFTTRYFAEQAINAVGKDNIIHMFKTFHGIYE